jgi:hypothetical protein
MFRLAVARRVGGVLLVLLLSGVTATETEIEQVKPKNGKAYEVGSEGALPAALKSEEVTVVEPESRHHPAETDPKAIVWFYRLRTSGSRRHDVYCDGVRLAKIADASYFIANLDPGHHVFRSTGKESIIEMDLVDGQRYYIQVVIEPGSFRERGFLVVRDSVPDLGLGRIWPGTLKLLQAKYIYEPDMLLDSARHPPLALPPARSELGSIGITVTALNGLSAERVYFVRLEDHTDVRRAKSVIYSNYHNGKQVYLLNAKPGRYVAVAARLWSGDDSVSEAFFSMEMIPLTEVTVGPGQMVFMGDFLVNLGIRISRADEAQAHYFRLISPNAVRDGLFDVLLYRIGGVEPALDRLDVVLREMYYTAKLDSVAKDAESERAFWGQASDKVFRKLPAWQKQVQRRLDALGEGGQ